LPSSNRKTIRQFARTVTAQKTLETALQRMQPEREQSEGIDRLGGIHNAKYLPDLADMLRIDPLRVVVFKKLPQPPVSKAFDHCASAGLAEV
jgi:hypothetical protein